jgi:hypothetical protein
MARTVGSTYKEPKGTDKCLSRNTDASADPAWRPAALTRLQAGYRLGYRAPSRVISEDTKGLSRYKFRPGWAAPHNYYHADFRASGPDHRRNKNKNDNIYGPEPTQNLRVPSGHGSPDPPLGPPGEGGGGKTKIKNRLEHSQHYLFGPMHFGVSKALAAHRTAKAWFMVPNKKNAGSPGTQMYPGPGCIRAHPGPGHTRDPDSPGIPGSDPSKSSTIKSSLLPFS